MTTEEAFKLSMDTVEELRRLGIEVVIKPSCSKDKKEIIEKYRGPERISPDKWSHVTFYSKDKEQTALIYIKAKELNWLGIGFDTGGCGGQRDWELDWSFRYTKEQNDNLEAGRDWVEKTIRSELEQK